MHACPSCEREFQNLTDFPLVYIVSASMIKEDGVPNKIKGDLSDPLLEKKTWGHDWAILPKEVLDYAKEHPTEDEFSFGSYIYDRPLSPNTIKTWSRYINYSSFVKDLLHDGSVKDYIIYLEGLVSKEVKKSELMLNLPRGLEFSDLHFGDDRPRTCKLNCEVQEGRQTFVHIELGQITYEGRINK